MNARICPHGNEDDLMNDIGKASATAQYDTLPLLLKIDTFLPMRLVAVNISGAYMKSGPITNYIFVRSPRKRKEDELSAIWKTLKLPTASWS